eukprot:TRINITY_DN13352_c0_g1_i1.p3 TRINITY_DN13352_c0_g1~~TRINITY_DN13352_c0_g1_i1.p3  ORF type:complete len:187 (-),score=39.01 TRINITY_DN13352_c0_g1_i1:138-698(-)
MRTYLFFILKEVSKYAKEIEYSKYENETKRKELEEQISAMKEYFQSKSTEYKSIKNLSRVILDQKSWVEGFFVESLDKVRQELRKNQQQKSKQKLPTLNNQQQETQSAKSRLDKDKVDISELEPEEKEKIMRILYYKITQGAQPLAWFDSAEQEQMEQNSLIQKEQEQEDQSLQQQLIESQDQSKK